MPYSTKTNLITPKQITAGYAEMAARYVEDGWIPYLLTFMFRQLSGGPSAISRQMEREIERIYTRFITRHCRSPKSVFAVGQLPVWIGGPDFPIAKAAKQAVNDIAVNDGQHVHIVALQPLRSRIVEDLGSHFALNERTYVDPNHHLARIHVVAITHDIQNVVAYTLKALSRGRVDAETTIILPRTRSELS